MKTNEAIHLVTECPIHLVTEYPIHLVTECPVHLVTECPVLMTLGYPILMTLGYPLLCYSFTMYFVIFTATTVTFEVKYLIIIWLSGGSRGGSRVAVVAAEAVFWPKTALFYLFFEQI